MTPDEYCQEKASKSGSSFYYSFLFLPPPRRRAITALYAFCREVDDVVDECSDVNVARTKLTWWRGQIAGIYDVGIRVDAPQHPVTQALVPVVKAFELPQEQLQEIIDGMEMDLTQRRYPDFAQLKEYCHRVAGVVGLLSAQIFGYRNAATLTYAENLGIAFQLTNIIRDVGEDSRRDRVYLPLDELMRYKVPVTDLMHARMSENFRQLMEFQVARARAYYRDAFAALPAEDRKTQRPGLVMASIYQTLLGEIRAGGMQVLMQRTSLTSLRKLWIAWKTWVTT